MKNNTLWKIWAGLFILCAVLGFIPEPEGLLKALMVLAAAGCFVPGGTLAFRALKYRDLQTLRNLRTVSALWLGLTLVALILNFAAVMFTEAMGNFLYGVLVVVSSPMICGQYWVASLFLWAVLLMVSISGLRKPGN